MNPFEQMELKKSTFTKREMEVYNVVANNVDDILRDSATQLADNFHISQSSITRFCQKLGYSGYNDFKYDVYKYSKSGNTTKDPNSVMDYYSQIIHLIPNAVSKDQLNQLAETIVNSRYTVCTGFHKSSLPAQLLDMNLHKFGILSSYMNYDHCNTIPQFMDERDTVIIISSTSSIYKTITDVIYEAGEHRPKIILITTSDKHVLKSKADQFVWLPSYKNQNYPQYLETQVVNLVFIDLLSSYIAEIV